MFSRKLSHPAVFRNYENTEKGGRKMSREKRLAKALACVLGLTLIVCTIASQLIYRRMLPRVRTVEAYWGDGGFVLPEDALYTGPQGTCVYCIEEKEERFGPKYLVKAVLVTVEARDESAGTVTVRGIYDDKWVYAAGANAPLADGAEVKPVP